jgi:hypothetical protein
MGAGAAYVGTHGDWTGEQNKIQWHSNHLYLQNIAGGNFFFRRADGTNLFNLDNNGSLIISGDFYPNGQGSYRLYVANSGLWTNGNFGASGDLYLGTRGTWLSSWLNQSVQTSANVRFSQLGLGAAADTQLSVAGTGHISDYLYLGGTAGTLNSWGTRTSGFSGYWRNASRDVTFNNEGYGTTWTFAINTAGAITLNRHIDANTAWGTSGATTIFMGWYGGKIMLGNNNDGAHDWANAIGGNSIISTNKHHFYKGAYMKNNVDGAEVLAVDGVNGRLFTVTDSLVDSIYSVNTIAGLPVFEVFANSTVTIGKYGNATSFNNDGTVTFQNEGIKIPYYNGGHMWFRTNTHWESISGIDVIGGAGQFRISSDSGSIDLRVDGSYITGSGTTSSQWDTAYNKRPTAISFSGGSTKTLTLTHGDGSTISAAFNDIDTDTDTNTDAQTLSLSGNTLSISGGNSVTLSSSGLSQATADGLYVRKNTWEGNSYIGTNGAIYGTIFYDSNDSTYYTDPASRSNIVALTANGKNHYFGTSSGWDGTGFSSLTNVHFQGHDSFWMGAGNAYWWGGGISTEHDLLITTMPGYDSKSYYRGITFAVDNNSNGSTGGYRLGRWQTYGTGWNTARLQVDASLSVGYGNRLQGGSYNEGSYPLDRGVWAHGRDTSGYGDDRVRSKLFSPTANGGGPWGSFASLEVSSILDGNNDIPALFRMHQWGSGSVEFWKPQGTTLYIRESPGGGGSWFTRLEVQGSQYITSSLQAYSYQGHSNVSGTGNASYHPSGIYSTGTNWMYGTMYLNNNIIYDINIAYASGSFRAPIFYDSENTAFYADPSGGSKFRNLYVGDSGSSWSDPGGWGTQLHVSNGPHAILRVYARNDGIETIMYSHGSNQSKVGSGTNHNFTIVRNFSDRMTFYSGYTYSEGYLQAADSLRAPIFYDSNDTGYYLDPNSESNLYKFTGATLDRNDGNSLHVNSPYLTRASQNFRHRNGTMGWGQVDLNVIASNWGSGSFDTWSSPANGPGASSHYVGIQAMHYSNSDSARFHGWQMACAQEADNRWFWRSAWDSPRAWVEMIHSGNIGSQSVNYATTAGSANSVAWGNVSGRPSNLSSFTNDLGNYGGWITSSGSISGSSGSTSAVNSTGWGNGNFTWYQTPGGLSPYTGSWASFLVSNHGDGSNYYNQTIIMPFWGAPQYSRREGGTNRGPWSFWTEENLNPITTSNIGSQSVSYATTSGTAARATRANGNFYIDDNYGNTVVGVYSSYRLQGVFAMGDSYKLAADGTSASNHYGIAWSHPNHGGTAANLTDHGILIQTAGVTRTAISSTIWCIGDIIAYSDAKVKANVEVIDNPLERLSKVRGVTFTRTDLEDPTKRYTGVIAQEMREALPEAVSENSNGELSVSYGNTVSLLIESIKAQQAQIEELKAEVKKLRGE